MSATRYILAGVLAGLNLLGLVYCLVWRYRHREPLIPPPRRYRHVPWSGPELTLVLLTYFGLPNLAMLILTALGLVAPLSDLQDVTPEQMRTLLIVQTLVSPFILAFSLALLWYTSRTKARHLGLSFWRWKNSLALAYVCYLVVTPIVLGVQFVATYVMKWQGIPMQEHFFVKVAESSTEPWIWCSITIQAVIAAPITEEFVYRGVILPWLSQRWWGGWAAMAGGIAIGLAMANESRHPLAFALITSLLAIALTFRHAGEQWARRAIAGTAILFAMSHVNFWPSPIPLLVLGLALGWAAHRTRGLITPIVLHSLFNSVATLMLLVGYGR